MGKKVYFCKIKKCGLLMILFIIGHEGRKIDELLSISSFIDRRT